MSPSAHAAWVLRVFSHSSLIYLFAWEEMVPSRSHDGGCEAVTNVLFGVKLNFNSKQHGDLMLCCVIWPCMYAILVKGVIRLQNCRANHSRTLVTCTELYYSSSRLSLWHLFTFSGMLSLLSLYILWYVILVIFLHSLVCYPCSIGCAYHQSLCLYLRISLWCVLELPCYINSMA